MDRSRNIFVTLGAALITFGVLTLALGQRHLHGAWDRFGDDRQYHRHHENCFIPHGNEQDSTQIKG